MKLFNLGSESYFFLIETEGVRHIVNSTFMVLLLEGTVNIPREVVEGRCYCFSLVISVVKSVDTAPDLTQVPNCGYRCYCYQITHPFTHTLILTKDFSTLIWKKRYKIYTILGGVNMATELHEYRRSFVLQDMADHMHLWGLNDGEQSSVAVVHHQPTSHGPWYC